MKPEPTLRVRGTVAEKDIAIRTEKTYSIGIEFSRKRRTTYV